MRRAHSNCALFSPSHKPESCLLHADTEETFYKSGTRADAEFQTMKAAATDVPKQNLMISHDVAQSMAQYRSSKAKALETPVAVAQNGLFSKSFDFCCLCFAFLMQVSFCPSFPLDFHNTFSPWTIGTGCFQFEASMLLPSAVICTEAERELSQQADDSEEDAPGLTFSSFSGHMALLDSMQSGPVPHRLPSQGSLGRGRTPIHPVGHGQGHSQVAPEPPRIPTKRDWAGLKEGRLNALQQQVQEERSDSKGELGEPVPKAHRVDHARQNQPVRGQEKQRDVPENVEEQPKKRPRRKARAEAGLSFCIFSSLFGGIVQSLFGFVSRAFKQASKQGRKQAREQASQ